MDATDLSPFPHVVPLQGGSGDQGKAIENGAQLGWLIHPFEKKVYVYRPRKRVQCLESPATLYGDPILPGFVFHIAEIWQE